MRNSPELIYVSNYLILHHFLKNTVSFKIKFNIIFPFNLIFQESPSF